MPVKNGHAYIWVPTQHGHYQHDANCPGCKEGNL